MDLPQNAHVLLIRLSAMGDVLFSLETLASLHRERPDVRVDYLVEDRFAALLEGHPLIDRLLVYPRRRKTAIPSAVRELRQRRYAAVLDLHGNLKSAVQARLARTRLRVGYGPPIARERAHLLYQRTVTLPHRPHRAEQGYHLLRALGLSGAPAPAALPSITAPTSGHSAEVILHPGTSTWAAFKRWPTRSFATLARRLSEAGRSVAVSYGPGERGLLQAVAAQAPDIIGIDGAGLGFTGLAGYYAAARVVVAADTGPLHLAAATGTPVVALFGPKDPELYGPRGDRHRVLFHPVPCRPCRRRACASPQCMLGLAVDGVEQAVLMLL